MKEVPRGKQKPIETHIVSECHGPNGIVPKGKKPGRDVIATVFPDITKRIDCNNFNSDKTCDLSPVDHCLFTHTPNSNLLPHALLHIANTENPSRTSLQDVLGISADTSGKIVSHLIYQGAVIENGLVERQPGSRGAPIIKLAATGEQPTTPVYEKRLSNKRGRPKRN